jgi:hypothetical protein
MSSIVHVIFLGQAARPARRHRIDRQHGSCSAKCPSVKAADFTRWRQIGGLAFWKVTARSSGMICRGEYIKEASTVVFEELVVYRDREKEMSYIWGTLRRSTCTMPYREYCQSIYCFNLSWLGTFLSVIVPMSDAQSEGKEAQREFVLVENIALNSFFIEHSWQ